VTEGDAYPLPNDLKSDGLSQSKLKALVFMDDIIQCVNSLEEKTRKLTSKMEVDLPFYKKGHQEGKIGE
jgi:hypothetical protein